MKISLFATCLVDLFQSNIGKSTVELLERLGCSVDFPKGQTCCGQPAYNSGYVKASRDTMKHTIRTFENAQYVVCPSGSCAYMLKEYPHLLEDEPYWQERAQMLALKTYELTQFIVDVLKIEDVGAKLEGTATYHPSCHMTRLLQVQSAPITLLRHVKGLEVIELPLKENCCGFGGTFSVKMSAISEQMVDEKVASIQSTGVHYLVGADAGCLMNIGGRMKRQNLQVETKHIAEILNMV
ncbi:(Fe-S)-binding protein [Lysinibacillus odysseyi]|uniref:Lactate utilization protein A n=1 Tax=Lysinibacillus odysseyi 34hs-1 = NBRC 100172 TaxID=1220589 RepID=A0A0A3JJN8_9BACI|nr:(Fe-S)-binding protein [Lysinibacillus odysseyi]KGR87207.1 Fe-S oxidoreductase [Lysinibacillus odysseyi 34hs-1 = NBRC 100172]